MTEDMNYWQFLFYDSFDKDPKWKEHSFSKCLDNLIGYPNLLGLLINSIMEKYSNNCAPIQLNTLKWVLYNGQLDYVDRVLVFTDKENIPKNLLHVLDALQFAEDNQFYSPIRADYPLELRSNPPELKGLVYDEFLFVRKLTETDYHCASCYEDRDKTKEDLIGYRPSSKESYSLRLDTPLTHEFMLAYSKIGEPWQFVSQEMSIYND